MRKKVKMKDKNKVREIEGGKTVSQIDAKLYR